MLFPSVALALSTLALTALASPIDLESRQVPQPTPPYVAQGVAILKCTKPNTVALTFDDGIYEYTKPALLRLASYGMKATFFLNGENYGILRNNKAVLQQMLAQGHQIASHTYSHAHLVDLSPAQVKKQMTDLEAVFLELIGQYPTYMRPPWLEYNAETLQALKDLKYRVISRDVETDDYLENVEASFKAFKSGLDRKGSIVLMHDVHRPTVFDLLPRILEELKSRGMKSVTVGECLGESPNNWYRYAPR